MVEVSSSELQVINHRLPVEQIDPKGSWRSKGGSGSNTYSKMRFTYMYFTGVRSYELANFGELENDDNSVR
jgi:hypothetical protein